MRIGKNIRYFRSQKGVSQQWLADAIGVSKMSISYFERDKRRPDIETVKRICSALNVSLGKFMAFSDSITLSDGSFQKSDELSAAQKNSILAQIAIQRSDTVMRVLVQMWIAASTHCRKIK